MNKTPEYIFILKISFIRILSKNLVDHVLNNLLLT